MTKLSQQVSLRVLAIGLLVSATSACVDHDYDLTEDIDMTLQLGGESLTVPASSTDIISLSQILNLNEDDSSIQAVKTDGEYGLHKGDYVLVQEGNSTPSYFDVPVITIGDMAGSTSTTALPEFYNVLGDVKITQAANPSFNTISLEDNNVTTDLVSLEYADVDVDITITVGYNSNNFTGKAYIDKDYTATFDPSWTVEITDAATAQFIESVDSHTIRFKEDHAITASSPLVVKLHISKIDFTNAGAGQGLYAPGHFKLNSKMETSGNVSISLSELPLGAKATLELVTTSAIERAQINKVRGIVDPKINIVATTFEINDIPDFLRDPANHLDIDNPQIHLTVTNTSPLSIELNGALTAYSAGNETATVKIGKANGTSAIIVRGNSTTHFVICRQAIAGEADCIVVPNLNTLIETIPDRFSFHDATSKAIQEAQVYTLGTSYMYNCEYKAVIPLAFGESMLLHYTHTEDGWDEDLKKLNFNTVEVNADVINTLPLDMTPQATALGKDGKEMGTITCTVDGTVAAGSLGKASTSPLKITLRSTGKNLNDIGGVHLVFDAKSNSAYRGVNLNEDQNIRFENINITVKGGVLVDLND